ncbi:hypothetical protein Taro_017624 [Colocasia esculenta]|uniref:LysM domain-containing protein n=1 Tax=Colocasia esculenta TaxID=4460 RepID=A0A843UNL3_COLES|nr:hypothetical protein [Colocasia esculenta]
MAAVRAPLLLFPLLILAASCAAQDGGPRFQCSGAATRCQALAGYPVDNETTYDAIRTLFQVKSIRTLYGFNNLSATTPISTRVPAGKIVKVPFPCTCANGTGVADPRPIYTVVAGDTLYNIATVNFKGLLKYQQIIAANPIIVNESLIEVGWRLRIPVPCNCDAVDGVEAVHLAHVVAKGSSLETIATQFGTTQEILSRINNISDPKSLEAGQVLDVPLTVCNSSIRSDSRDYVSLRVPVGSYALTAGNCVKCSCGSSSSLLQCEMAQNLNISRGSCRAETCSAPAGASGPTSLGDSVLNACGSTRCEYAGFNSSLIFTAIVNEPTCGPASGAHALWPQPWSWMRLLLPPLQTALLLLALL